MKKFRDFLNENTKPYYHAENGKPVGSAKPHLNSGQWHVKHVSGKEWFAPNKESAIASLKRGKSLEDSLKDNLKEGLLSSIAKGATDKVKKEPSVNSIEKKQSKIDIASSNRQAAEYSAGNRAMNAFRGLNPNSGKSLKKDPLKGSIKEGEMDNNQAAAPGKKKPKPGAFDKTKQQMPKDQNKPESIDTQQPNQKPLTGKDPVKGVIGGDQNQEKISLKGLKTKVDLKPKLQINNPPLSPSVKEETLLEKIKKHALKKKHHVRQGTFDQVDKDLNKQERYKQRKAIEKQKYLQTHPGIKTEGQFLDDVKSSWKDIKRSIKGNTKNYMKGKKKEPVKEGEVINTHKHEFEGKKAMAMLTRMRGEAKKKDGKVLPFKKKTVNEVAPPGREDQVKTLKKKFPGDKAAAFKIAWSSYNKKKTVNEMSKGKIANYVKGAHADILKRKANQYAKPSEARKNSYKIIQRTGGIHKAVDKLTETLDRNSPLRKHIDKMDDHTLLTVSKWQREAIEKARKKASDQQKGELHNEGTKLVTVHYRKGKAAEPGGPAPMVIKKRYKLPKKSDASDIEFLHGHHQMIKTGHQKTKIQERAINELSTDKLTKYTRAATKDTQKVEKHYTDAVAKGDTKVDFVKMFRKVGNRAVGINRAQKRIGHTVNEAKVNIDPKELRKLGPDHPLNKAIKNADTKKANATSAMNPKHTGAKIGKITLHPPKPFKPPEGYIHHPHPDHPNDSSKGTWGPPSMRVKVNPGGTNTRAGDVLPKRTAAQEPHVNTPRSTGKIHPRVAGFISHKDFGTKPPKDAQKVTSPGATARPKINKSGGLLHAFVQGFAKKLTNDTEVSPTLRVIREAMHAKGGGHKGEGSAGQDTAGDTHPITVLRKAAQLGSADLHHHSGEKTTVDRHTARHLLSHYESHKNPDHKIQMVSRMWHSSGEFENVHHGRPAKAGTFGTEKRASLEPERNQRSSLINESIGINNSKNTRRRNDVTVETIR